MAKRTPKPPNPQVRFGDTIEDTVVPDSVVRTWENLQPVRRAMDRIHDGEEWGFEDLRRYVARREWEKKLAWEAHTTALVAKTVQAPTVPGSTSAAPLETVEAAVQRVMNNFPDLTEVNRPMVRQRELYYRALRPLAAQVAEDIASNNMKDVRSKQQIMTDMQREVRQIESALGLDAGSLRSGGVDEIRREIYTVMDRAKALLDKHAVRITCPACRASKAERHINMGYILFHFRQDVPFHFFTICPHPECNQGIHISGGPGEETVIENAARNVGPLRR